MWEREEDLKGIYEDLTDHSQLKLMTDTNKDGEGKRKDFKMKKPKKRKEGDDGK